MREFHKCLVFLVVLLVTMLDLGCVFSFGALFMSISETYQMDRASTALVQSLLIGVMLGTGIINGVLLTRVGLPLSILIASILTPAGFCASFFASSIYFLYFSIGIVSALGLSMVYVSSIVLIGNIFTGKQRLVCLSVMHTANAVCALIYPYLLTWLADIYGLRGTFLIIGGSSLNTFAFFLVCWFNENDAVPKPEKNVPGCVTDSLLENVPDNSASENVTERHKLPVKTDSSSPFLILKNMMTKQYVCLLVGTGACLTSLNGFVGLVLDIALWKGLSNNEGLTSFLCFNIFVVISRLIPGLLKLKKGVNSFMYPIISTVSGCVGQVLVYFANDRVVYMTGCSLTGIAYGGVVSSSINVAVCIMPQEQVAMACGLLATAEGILSAAAGPVFGNVRDISGSYSSILIAIFIVQAFAATMYTLALLSRRQEKRNATRPVSLETEIQC